MKWTVSRVDEECGLCGAVILADEPFALLCAARVGRRLIRCTVHAGAPVDGTEVELERFRLEEDLRREASARLAHRAAAAKPRVRVYVPPRPAREFAHLRDGKRAAVHD